MGNVLGGQNVAEISNMPRATGLPQIDLMQQRPQPVFGMKPRPKKVLRRVIRKVPRPDGSGVKRLLKRRRK